jgi:hypothetical protein
MTALPTITAGQVAELASRFARQLADRLGDINRQHPAAELDPEFQDIIDQARARTLRGPTPAEAIPTFERLFLAFIASRYMIVPDQP